MLLLSGSGGGGYVHTAAHPSLSVRKRSSVPHVFTHAAGGVQLLRSKQGDVLRTCALGTVQLPEFPALHIFTPQPCCQRLFVYLFLTGVGGKVKEMDLWFSNVFESSFKYVLYSYLFPLNMNDIFSNFN